MSLTFCCFLPMRCSFNLIFFTISKLLARRLDRRCLLKHLFFMMLTSLWPVVSAAQFSSIPAVTENGKSVLLLRNGQTFTGLIAKPADMATHYIVLDPLGNRLRFPSDQVEFVSDSLLEIYAYRRASQIRNNATACLQLAQWCMQSQLFTEAQDQINNAIAINGRSRAAVQLEIRLDLLRSASVSSTAESTNTNASRSIIDADIVQRRIDQLSAGVLQQFIHSIQPLLLNRCAVAGCHGPSPRSSYLLFRTSAKHAVPHRVSQRNLYNTLATLDLDKPDRSLLLTAATTSHGAQTKPSLEMDASEDITTLVNWVRVVATNPARGFHSDTINHPTAHRPIMYQQGNSQQTTKMQTPDTKPSDPALDAPDAATQPQQWTQSQKPEQTQSALGFGAALPVEMLGPTLGRMKLMPTKSVNLTPNFPGNFSLPSSRFLPQRR